MDFLKMSGAGLAGAVLLGTAGCDGGGQGATELYFTAPPDESGNDPASPAKEPSGTNPDA